MLSRMAAASLLLGLAAAGPGCGGGGSPPTQSTPVPVTETFSGTTTQSGPGSCGGDSHDVTAADGEMSVRLLSTTDPAAALSVQVCAGGIDNRDCSINQQKIAVGQTLAGPRKGGPSQNLKLLPHNCVFGGPVTAAPVAYSVSLTYMK